MRVLAGEDPSGAKLGGLAQQPLTPPWVMGSMLGTEPVPGGAEDALTEALGRNLHGQRRELSVKPVLGLQKQETQAPGRTCDGAVRGEHLCKM